jgi:hypothetical protein
MRVTGPTNGGGVDDVTTGIVESADVETGVTPVVAEVSADTCTGKIAVSCAADDP